MKIDERKKLSDLVYATLDDKKSPESQLENRHDHFVGFRAESMTPALTALPAGAIEQFIIMMNQFTWGQSVQHLNQDMMLDPIKDVIDSVQGSSSGTFIPQVPNEFTRLDSHQKARIEFVTACYIAINELSDPQSTAPECGRMWEMISLVAADDSATSAVKLKFYVGEYVLQVKPGFDCVIVDSRLNATVFINRMMTACLSYESGFPIAEFNRLAELVYPDLIWIHIEDPAHRGGRYIGSAVT